MRIALAIVISLVVFGASADARGGTESDAAAAGPADIELRKSFRSSRREGRHQSRSGTRGGSGNDQAATNAAAGIAPVRLGAVAEALDELLQSSGTLHLPGVGGSGIVLDGSTTPILETASGRRLVLDPERTVAPGLLDEIERRWPAFTVVQPAAGADLRDVIGTILDAAGYASVLRGTPLIFGREITVRVAPDFVVLRSERDLLAGDVRSISVVEPDEDLPPELRELAAEHRVRIVELRSDGSPAGVDRAPWRDATGRVTTMAATRSAPIVEEVAVALGLSVQRRAALPTAAGESGTSADLMISRDGNAVPVFERTVPRGNTPGVGRHGTAIELDAAADLTPAIGELLGRFGIPAIGPVVEFHRAPQPGSTRRFVISVPGWLVESGDRRLLITGTTPPPLVRLYLTREGIDIFEYRIRNGR